MAKLHEAFDMSDLEDARHILCILCVIKSTYSYGYPKKIMFAKCLSISIWWGGRH